MNFKEMHIGELIEKRVSEIQMPKNRILDYLNCRDEDIKKMYKSKDLSTDTLLKLSKLLEYDFFRIYTQHLIFYNPLKKVQNNQSEKQSGLPRFRKNVYTKEIISFILESISSGEKTKLEIIAEYRIPKTTLYKWIEKYKV